MGLHYFHYQMSRRRGGVQVSVFISVVFSKLLSSQVRTINSPSSFGWHFGRLDDKSEQQTHNCTKAEIKLSLLPLENRAANPQEQVSLYAMAIVLVYHVTIGPTWGRYLVPLCTQLSINLVLKLNNHFIVNIKRGGGLRPGMTTKI